MKKIFTLLAIWLYAGAAYGQNLLLEEHFNYPADSLIRDFGWTPHSAGATNPIQVTNGGLSWTTTPYLGSGIGNAAAVNNTGSDENKPFTTFVDSGDVYVSFLMRVNNEVTSSNTGYFFHIGQYSNITNPVFTSISTAFRARTFITPGTTPAQFKLGLSFNTNAATGFSADLDTAVTYLVVLKYSFIPGPLNDSVSLFLFADGDNITTEPTTPTIGPLAGSVSDLDIAQLVALRQYQATQDITVDGIIVKDGWDLLPPPPLSGPSLISPINNSFLDVAGAPTTSASISWTTAQNSSGPVTYTWQLASRAAGNFNNPLLSIVADNGGADTTLTLTYSAIDAALASLSVAVGDTVEGSWRVRAIDGTDTSFSNVFDIDIRRGAVVVPLSNFSLLTPPNFTILPITGAGNQTATIQWTASSAGTQAITYEWLAIAPGGSFATPVVALPAGGNGSDTSLVLTYAAIDALLASLNFNLGDSVFLDWTVRATAGSQTQLATQTWRITLFRGGLTQPMSSPTLLTPVNNSMLLVIGLPSQSINIQWSSVQNNPGAVSYQWQLANRNTANFNSPLLSIAANNNGADTALTLTYGRIDTALTALGLIAGDTLPGIWRIRAIAGTDTTFSNVFNLDLLKDNLTVPLSNFSLLAPPNNTILPISGTPTQTATIRWTAAHAGTLPVTYHWLAIAPGGNFNTPVVGLPAGSDTSLVLSYAAVDALLASLNFNIGDSIYLDWTVQAIAGTQTQLASQTWRITLFRGGLSTLSDTLAAFALLTPPNNTALTVQGDPTQLATITWESSAASLNAAPTNYTWLLDVPTGDFSTPVLVVNAGSNMSIALPFGAIADSLTAKGIPVGATFNGKWTVRATADTLNRLANVPFNINITRGIMSSVQDDAFSLGTQLYPNPAADRVSIKLPAAENGPIRIKLLNAMGQDVQQFLFGDTQADRISIDLGAYPNGTYLIKIQANDKLAVKRLVIQR